MAEEDARWLALAEQRLRANLQRRIEDIPIFCIRLNAGPTSFRRLMWQRHQRLCLISAIIINGNPVTPPVIDRDHVFDALEEKFPERFHSFHIVEVQNPNHGSIQLLFRESDLYFVAFRFLKWDANRHSTGGWFRFYNEHLPSFLQSSSIYYGSEYGDISNLNVGAGSLLDMYHTLRQYTPANAKRWHKERNRAVRVPALMLSEAQRFKEVQKEVIANLAAGCAHNLGHLNKLMRDWILKSRRTFKSQLVGYQKQAEKKEYMKSDGEKDLWILKYDPDFVLMLIRWQVAADKIDMDLLKPVPNQNNRPTRQNISSALAGQAQREVAVEEEKELKGKSLSAPMAAVPDRSQRTSRGKEIGSQAASAVARQTQAAAAVGKRWNGRKNAPATEQPRGQATHEVQAEDQEKLKEKRVMDSHNSSARGIHDMISHSGSSLTPHDVESLRGSNWLTDGPIGYFFNHLTSTVRAVVSEGSRRAIGEIPEEVLLLPPSSSVLLSNPETTAEIVTHIDLASRRLVLLPINDSQADGNNYGRADRGMHWSLLVMDNTSGIYRFLHHDSLGMFNHAAAQRMVSTLREAIPNLFRDATLVEAPTPRQTNGSDCGLYVMTIADIICQWWSTHRSNNINLLSWFDDVMDLTPRYIREFRDHLLKEIESKYEGKKHDPQG